MTKPVKRTLNSALSDAEICRLKGWRKGTALEGDEGLGKGMERIKITAVGIEIVLATGPGDCGEYPMDLTMRNWRKAEGRP